MRRKYIIPVLIGAMLVATIAPASATTFSLSPAQSYIYPGNDMRWYGTPSDSQKDVSVGDNFAWDNWWYHGDSTYSGTHTVWVHDKISTISTWEVPVKYDDHSQYCISSLTYGQSWTATALSYSVTGSPNKFTRYHKSDYNGNSAWTSNVDVALI